MKKFALQLLGLTVALSALVWTGLPWLKTHRSADYDRLVDAFASGRGRQELAIQIAAKAGGLAETVKDAGADFAATTSRGISEVVAPAPDSPTAVADAPDPDSARPTESSASEPPASAPEVPPSGASVASAQNGAAPAEAEAVAPAEAPAPADPAAALNADPGFVWGLVVTNSFFYDAQMNRVGILAGGTVVARKSVRLLNDGNIAECCYLGHDRMWVYEPVHVYESDLIVFDTPYEQANREQRDLLVEYCKLYGRYEAAKAKLYKDVLMRNPHLEEHQETAKAYREFSLRAKAIHEEHQNTTGARRSALEDQLRKMKGEEGDIKRRYEEAKVKYDAWKQQNVLDPAAAGRLKTPDMQSYENRMNALRPAVQAIVPGL